MYKYLISAFFGVRRFWAVVGSGSDSVASDSVASWVGCKGSGVGSILASGLAKAGAA